MKNQSSARDFSIELLHVADADCDFSVSQIEGEPFIYVIVPGKLNYWQIMLLSLVSIMPFLSRKAMMLWQI